MRSTRRGNSSCENRAARTSSLNSTSVKSTAFGNVFRNLMAAFRENDEIPLHALAGVEQQADVQGHGLLGRAGAEIGDRLQHAVFSHLEIVGLEILHRLAGAVDHRHGKPRHVDAGLIRELGPCR